MAGGVAEVGIRLFGPLAVTVGCEPVELKGDRLRTLLAVLAMSAGECVAVDTLADRVWGEELPDRVKSSLHTLIARLRQALGADAVQTRHGGYVFAVSADQVDVLRFKQADGPAAALQEWTGEPFCGTKSDWLATTVLPQLVELRLSAVERLADLEPSDELLAQLQELTAAYPLRESLWIRLLRMLAAAGRSAEALGRYDVIRARLADELGVGPGADLQQLHADLLAADAELHRHRAPDTDLHPAPDADRHRARDADRHRALDADLHPHHAAHAAHGDHRDHRDRCDHGDRCDRCDQCDQRDDRADLRLPHPIELDVPKSLPADLPTFTGRAAELAVLTALPGGVMVAAVDGMAGVGKTALVVRAAHQLAPSYPDGQVFVDLHGHTDGVRPADAGDVVARLLEVFGVPADRVPRELDDRAGLLRTLLADRRVLLVLDNAVDEAQVRPLLPGTPGSGVLITSRHRLADLDTTAAVSLQTLPPDDAVHLFTTVAGRSGTPPAVLTELVEQCGLLPLAIRISAARLRSHPSWTAEQLLERLRSHEHRLTELTAGPRSVAAAIDLSYRELGPDLRRAYRRLGLHPGADFDTSAAAALLDLDNAATSRALEQLLNVHLLQEPAFGRYQFHDLVRDHARTVAADESPAALTRLVDYYCQAATEATASRYPNHTGLHHHPDAHPITSTPDDWLQTELPNLLLITEQAGNCTLHFSASLYPYLRTVGRLTTLEDLHHRALDVARATNNTTGETDLLLRLGECHRVQGIHAQALEEYGEALKLARTSAYRSGEMRALHGLGLVHGTQDRNSLALRELHESLAVAESMDNQSGRLAALNGLGWMCGKLGDHAASLEFTGRALIIARAIDHRSVGKLLTSIAHAHLLQADPLRAIEFYQQGLEHARDNGNLHNQLRSLDGLAESHRHLGAYSDAFDCREQAMDLARDLGSPNWEFEAHQGFGRLHLTVGRPNEALDSHRRALELATQLYQPVDQARAYDGLAYALAALGRCEEARQHWQRALTILETVGVETSDDPETSVAVLRGQLEQFAVPAD
ncbi:AfsR/SARP family transcriptional regulator [Kribbella jiaozuonensis]|uniref:Tetratricopeptide repeat protein n=1 Tax=Kribbella jiaozuonensis TaxID=2575441 RepID=A0A4U3LV54_9ACTN|nr:tetratricopeptide repeat protein [Kribbella jiaozuonensis]TKK79750.1 tetratricopeptide repeat protein [Kribbella jiaozuonensis]